MAIPAAIRFKGKVKFVVHDSSLKMSGSADVDPPPWAEFISRLNSYVAKRVAASDRDDIVGEILLRLVRHQEKITAAREPIAWVMRVAANAVTDHFRRQASERKAKSAYRFEPTEMQTDFNQFNQHQDGSATDDISACVAALLTNVPEPYREALRLIEVDGLSQLEAARQIGLSVSGMKSRVQRGRKKLKQSLLRCCKLELDRRGNILDYHTKNTPSCNICNFPQGMTP